MLITIFALCMTCWHRNRINGRRLGTARPFPLWRLHSGPQSSSVDQYSETPPEHLASTVAEAMRRSVVTRHCLSKKLDAETGRVPRGGCRGRAIVGRAGLSAF